MLYFASGMACCCGVKKDSAILYRPVNISDHGTHIPRAIGFPSGGVLFRIDIFFDDWSPGTFVAFVDTAITVTNLCYRNYTKEHVYLGISSNSEVSTAYAQVGDEKIDGAISLFHRVALITYSVGITTN